MNKGQRMHSPSLAWLVPGPSPDERLGSIVSRAARMYDVTESILIEELFTRGLAEHRDVDGWGACGIRILAQVLGVAPKTLWALRLPDHPRYLNPAARRAICPKCWQTAAGEGRPPAHLRSWAYVLRTMCGHHAVPLTLPGIQSRPFIFATITPFEGALDGESLLLLKAIEQFGITLESALFDQGVWPARYRLTADQARAAMLLSCLNVTPEAAFPALNHLVFAQAHPELLHVFRHIAHPIDVPPWEALRLIDDPGIRRAALLVVAALTDPSWPERWRPSPVRKELQDLLTAPERLNKASVHALFRTLEARINLPGTVNV